MKLELRLQSWGLAVLLVLVLRLPPEVDAVCEVGWTEFDHNCYNYVSTKATFPEAMGLCIREGYDLLEINSASEASFIQKFVKANNSTSAWIGVNDLVVEGQWVSSSELTPLKYNNWGPNQPDNYENEEDCAEFYPNLDWNDYSCRKRNDFICEGHELEY
ncbi:perlucin-like [Pomacea canaliculata]|uniref:perlucin-like n=1 Tax=Pomacea canaliculata TaxID=400727 RepID=UPI000D7370BA|nr:perlucin-like [Pomacea canaliculata]